jgi:hypothetical protein
LQRIAGTIGTTDEMLQSRRQKLLQLSCLAMWCGLLVAGLWPFNFFPGNKVEWLGGKNGIHFGGDGQIYGSVPWNVSEVRPDSSPSDSFSVEIWLQPDKVCGCLGTIFSTYDPARPENFVLDQSIGDLVVRGHFRDHKDHLGFRSLYLDDVFQKGRSRFVTITSGQQGTTIYLEGVRSRFYPYALEADSLSGRLLAGHSAAGSNAWAGTLLGLAIYNRVLTAEEVSGHYKAWSEASTAELAAEKGIAVLYPFDERTGGLVRNHVAAMPDFVIPGRFYILHRTFLVLPSKFQRSDWDDAAVNILGFVPFGLLISAYFGGIAQLPRWQSLFLTILVGGITSLFIEFIQAYLPTRDSSLLDLINNTLGTTLGAMMFGTIGRVRSIFAGDPSS